MENLLKVMFPDFSKKVSFSYIKNPKVTFKILLPNIFYILSFPKMTFISKKDKPNTPEAMSIDRALKKDEKGFERILVIEVLEAVVRWRIKVTGRWEGILSKNSKKKIIINQKKKRKTNTDNCKKGVNSFYHMHCS